MLLLFLDLHNPTINDFPLCQSTPDYTVLSIFKSDGVVRKMPGEQLTLTKWSRNMTDESSTQIMNVLLTPSSNSNLRCVQTPTYKSMSIAH